MSRSFAACVAAEVATELSGARWLMVVVLAMAAVAGCVGRVGPDVQRVEGRVLLDDAPLAGATVAFSPVSPSGALPATGVTDSAGAFVLTTVQGGRSGAGAMIGEYLVSVTKVRMQAVSESGPTRPSGGDPGPPAAAVMISEIPEAYGDRNRSGLRATVGKGVNRGAAFEYRLVGRQAVPGK